MHLDSTTYNLYYVKCDRDILNQTNYRQLGHLLTRYFSPFIA